MHSSNHENLLRFYWCLSVLLEILGVAAMIRVGAGVQRMRQGTALKSQLAFLRGFIPLLLGTTLMTIVFLSFDVTMLIGFATNRSIDIPRQACFAMAGVFAAGVCTTVTGTAFATFQVWRVMTRSLKLSAKIKIHLRIVFRVVFVAAAIGLVWLGILIQGSLIGDYQRLFCVAETLGDVRTGGVLLLLLFSGLGTTLGFVWNFRTLPQDLKLSNPVAQSYSFAYKVIAGFCVAWSPLTISILMSLGGVPPPLEWDVFALLVLKLKPILDCTITCSCSALRRPDNNSSNGTIPTEPENVWTVDLPIRRNSCHAVPVVLYPVLDEHNRRKSVRF